MITLETHAGDRIVETARKALKMSSESGDVVTFSFGGRAVQVCGGEDDPVSFVAIGDLANPIRAYQGQFDAVVEREWERVMQEDAKKYRESPEGRADAARYEKQLARDRGKMAGMIALLPPTFRDHRTMLKWMASYGKIADHSDVPTNAAAVLKTLSASGYERNYGVGRPPEQFETDFDLTARWIAGQAIDALARGMPPHPISSKFIDQALAIRSDEGRSTP